jgi:hypothetical protein
LRNRFEWVSPKQDALQLDESIHVPSYALRTPDYYLSQIDPHILASLNSEQIELMRSLLDQAIPQPSPKIVDLRFVVDLIFSRFYVVLFVGKDRRGQPRKYIPRGAAKVGNIVAAIALLVGANLVISAFLVLLIYLIKSAIGIDLTPGHFSDWVQKVF